MALLPRKDACSVYCTLLIDCARTRAYRMKLDDWGFRKNKTKKHRVSKNTSQKALKHSEPADRNQKIPEVPEQSNPNPAANNKLVFTDEMFAAFLDMDSTWESYLQFPEQNTKSTRVNLTKLLASWRLRLKFSLSIGNC